jgi:cbb3-type cytochrome oxidase subunit 3
MKLSDIVGNSGLSSYAEIALILFLLAFLLVVVRLLVTRSSAFDRAARLPLDDDLPTPGNAVHSPRSPAVEFHSSSTPVPRERAD